MKRIFIIIVSIIFSEIYISAEENNSNTIVTPHLNITLSPTCNIVYNSSFHLAWKQLQNNIIGDFIKTEPSLKLISILNQSNPTIINDDDFLSISGFVGDGINEKIIDIMHSKFNTSVDFTDYLDDPYNIICYSYLNKHLEFKTKFESFDQLFPFFYNGKSTDVHYFGIWTAGGSIRHKGIRKQVSIVEHVDSDNFIITLSNHGSKEEVILAMIPELNSSISLASVVKSVMKKVTSLEYSGLVDNDRLLIPKISLKLEHEFDELYGLHLANEGYKDYFFSAAINNVSFVLNESGAYANSEAKLILKKGPGPRTMIINKPFILLLREKTSDKPYLAAWIVNPELLVKTDIN
jgi:hypothetical protein